jgi:hypothetical protein
MRQKHEVFADPQGLGVSLVQVSASAGHVANLHAPAKVAQGANEPAGQQNGVKSGQQPSGASAHTCSGGQTGVQAEASIAQGSTESAGQHAGAESGQQPSGAPGQTCSGGQAGSGSCGGGFVSVLVGALMQELPSLSPEQHCEGLSAGFPTGLQAHVRILSPFLFFDVTEKPWQHCLQLSVSPFLPRGFLAGHFFPVGIQASALAVPSLRPCFLARLSAPSPTADSTAAPSEPPTRERRESTRASCPIIRSNVCGSTLLARFRRRCGLRGQRRS